MPGVITDEGIEAILSLVYQIVDWSPFDVGLFKNNHTPVVGDTMASLTEADFPGYAPVNLNSTPTHLPMVAHVGFLQWNAVSFTRSSGAGSQTIYGYFVREPVSPQLLWAQLLPVPVVVTTVGQIIIVTPQYSLQDIST